jgi:hypothetical protein
MENFDKVFAWWYVEQLVQLITFDSKHVFEEEQVSNVQKISWTWFTILYKIISHHLYPHSEDYHKEGLIT